MMSPSMLCEPDQASGSSSRLEPHTDESYESANIEMKAVSSQMPLTSQKGAAIISLSHDGENLKRTRRVFYEPSRNGNN
jgi:hypothetical protein